MKLIAQNPYRVLGAFADEPVKVQTANVARIRAFAKVGKECAFESDGTEIFGSIDRSESAIESAMSLLSNADKEPLYASLWLHKTHTLDTGATDISDIIRSQLKDDSLDAAYNVIVCSLWSQHKELFVEYALKVFEKDKCLQLQTKSQILKHAEDYFTECARGRNNYLSIWPFFEKKCNEGSISPDCIKLIRQTYHNFAIEEAMSMAKAISECKPELFWSIPYWVEKNMQNVVGIARSTIDSGDENLAASTQLALTQLGISLLNAAKDYYAAKIMWHERDCEHMLDSLRYAYRLICDSKAKEECSEFGKKVKSQKQYLAPNEVIKHARFIRKSILDFCEKPEEVYCAIQLIKDCFTPLVEIKTSLGSENLYYRRVSTQIADNAIYSADVDLSSAEQLYQDPANSKQTATTHLQTIIRQCRILACDIEMYDVEENFLNGKFATYKKRVMRVAEKYGFDDEEVAADITLTLESDEFAACGNDYDKLCEFAKTHREGIFHEQAVSKIHAMEDAAWPKNLTAKNLFEYKRKFPNSHNENKILEALDHLLLGANNSVISDYRTMLQLFPAHCRISEIHDRIEFLIFNQCSSVPDYQEYLDAYPKGKYVLQAKENVKSIKQNELSLLFAQCKTISDYNRFILKYPTSNLCANAKQRIEDLRWEEVKRSGDIASYLKQYPDGRYGHEATQLLARKQAQEQEAEENRRFNTCETISDFKAYIKEYPTGRYFDIANAVIQRHNRKVFICALFAILTIVGIIFLSLNDSSKSQENNMVDNVSTIQSDNNNENLSPTFSTSSSQRTVNSQSETKEVDWIQNRLSTGSRPYGSHYGQPLSGENEFHFKTSSGCDYVILIKLSDNNRYVDHKYVRGGDQITITVPDGTYNVFLYTGNGWNPNTSVGACTGGFVSDESFPKDGPVTMTATIKGDYYYNQTCEYTLYPVRNGNLHLMSSNPNEAFD